jgi:hypothetical protein
MRQLRTKPEPLYLEVGQRYKTRGGSVATVVSVSGPDPRPVVAVLEDGSCHELLATGRRSPAYRSHLDLVSLWEPASGGYQAVLRAGPRFATLDQARRFAVAQDCWYEPGELLIVDTSEAVFHVKHHDEESA